MNDEDFESLKFLELKYRRVDKIIPPLWRIGSPKKLRSPFFNLKKFQKIDKSTGESIGTHGSALNDEEFESFKFLKLKYRRGDQIIPPFCRTASP